MADEQTTIEAENSSMSVTRIILIVAGVLIGLIVGVVIVAVLLAQGNVEQIAPVMQIIRDVFLIFLAVQGIMIVLALTVLIAQIARLINLLQNEVQPILKNTQDTVQTAKETVQFVSSNVTQPLIAASSFFAGVGVLLGNLGGIRKALRRTDAPKEEKKD
jgi:sulfite exporter TauE/SafE